MILNFLCILEASEDKIFFQPSGREKSTDLAYNTWWKYHSNVLPKVVPTPGDKLSIGWMAHFLWCGPLYARLPYWCLYSLNAISSTNSSKQILSNPFMSVMQPVGLPSCWWASFVLTWSMAWQHTHSLRVGRTWQCPHKHLYVEE